jgi:probable F420-dependent oxidoreductase
MKFALYGLHRGSGIDADTLSRRAVAAEDAGFESIWVGDHIALPRHDTSGNADPRLEALVTLTYLAAVTHRVRLGVGVIVLPQRHPVLLAKQLTSIDVLSVGRLTVGIGVGYVEAELKAFGVTLAERAARTDEYLAAVMALWDEAAPDFTGTWVSFAGIVEEPPPVQLPRPPIVVGGHSEAALSRAIRFGDGWFGWDLDADETAATLQRLHALSSIVQRPAHLRELEITVKPKGAVDLDAAKRFAECGVDRLVLHPPSVWGISVDELIADAGEHLIGLI